MQNLMIIIIKFNGYSSSFMSNECKKLEWKSMMIALKEMKKRKKPPIKVNENKESPSI